MIAVAHSSVFPKEFDWKRFLVRFRTQQQLFVVYVVKYMSG